MGLRKKIDFFSFCDLCYGCAVIALWFQYSPKSILQIPQVVRHLCLTASASLLPASSVSSILFFFYRSYTYLHVLPKFPPDMNKRSLVFLGLSLKPCTLQSLLLSLPLFCFHFDRRFFIEEFFLQVCHETFSLKFSLENF